MAQGAIEPAFQQAAAHGGGGFIHDPGQCMGRVALLINVNFQIPAAGRINHDGVIRVLDLERAHVWQIVALGIAGVMQQCPGSADGQCHVFATEAAQVSGFELLGQQAKRGVRVEMPGCHASGTIALTDSGWYGVVFVVQQFSRSQSFNLC